jgi:hypothetical protein
MNIFEGARRITKLIAVVWGVLCVVLVFKTLGDTRGQEASLALGLTSLILFGGWLFLWICAAAIGWVMRGFLGIPRGHDHKPEGTSSPPREATSHH